MNSTVTTHLRADNSQNNSTL